MKHLRLLKTGEITLLSTLRRILLKETTKWTKSSDADPNRGLASSSERQILDRFLGLIAGLAPPLLYHEIIEDTTCITDIYRLLRNYYSFSPSEGTFIKYYSIRENSKENNLKTVIKSIELILNLNFLHKNCKL